VPRAFHSRAHRCAPPTHLTGAGLETGNDAEPAAVEEDDSDDEFDSGKLNRQEKKARKALAKLGMKPFPGIKKVTVRKSKATMFIIEKPEVFKSSADTYVIFGEAKVEEPGAAQQAQAQQYAQSTSPEQQAFMRQAMAGRKTETAAADAEDGGDETGLDEKDISLVMEQASVTRARAVAALKKNDKDIVNAIMELAAE
jgi:nascent polypeptide-associated complex subunit alpha